MRSSPAARARAGRERAPVFGRAVSIRLHLVRPVVLDRAMTDSALEQVAEGVSAAEDTLRFPGGVRVPVRMVVIRLGDGGLWLHSPLRATDARVARVSELGPVRHLVAPNCLHHLFIGEWKQRFPEARVHGAEGLAAKRKDLAFDTTLAGPDPAWRDDLDQVRIEGAPKVGETVFLHRPSRTLLVTDLVFNIPRPRHWPSRLAFALTGVSGRLGQSRAWRIFTRDREAARESLERVFAWDFDRLVPAHGDIVASGAKALLEQAPWRIPRPSR